MEFKRVDIKTGYVCNNNCLFCVQAHNKKYGNRSTTEIIKYLKGAKNNNCAGVVFTGGEVTIRNDLLELIKYAKKLKFKRIQLQTNARILSSKKLCEKLIAAGVNEFSPALHGHTAKLHDSLTRVKGSFNQTVKAIKNLRELNQYILTNSVVVKPNYKYLPELANLFVKLKVNQFQFAFMHAIGNARDNFDEMMPKISLAAPYIKKGLQIGIDNNINAMAEAMPFCTMKRYEKYCSEFYIPKTEVRSINGCDLKHEKTRKENNKLKFPKCKVCKYDNICEGPWKEYPEKKGN
ncbi:radical SAM protein, partial [Candidatus Woesearchaeota archaeon]|nr:radical SAM protein [Candidatus Woesearchaeota archaeon]